MNGGRPDLLDALSVQNSHIFFAESVLIHEIGTILPHKTHTINNWGTSC